MNNYNNYYKKYLKYKKKYLNLKQYGGNPIDLNIIFNPITYQTMADCVKELIEASYNIYNDILRKGIQTTIICGGQSPSYYSLAMMHFSIFNPELVNIVILPHSKGGVKSSDIIQENVLYCERLKEKNIHLFQNVIIIDGVHTGTGILALESALHHCYPDLVISKFALNSQEGIAKINVDKEIILPCEPKFSDTFPRLVVPYPSWDFDKPSKFITEFQGIDTNQIAQMIIDIAKVFPNTKVEDTEWYKLNNNITDEIKDLKEKKLKEIELKKLQTLGFYKPIILTNPKRYQCPECKNISGTSAPLNPSNLNLFQHTYYCSNKNKIPVENIDNL